MRTYETTFIINPQSDDATIDKHVNEVADIITKSKGKILHQENMGTRRLAYEINGLTQGFYANFVYQAPQNVIPALDRHFKLNEAYIRNLTIRFDGDPEEIFNKKELMSRKHDENFRNSEGGDEKPKGAGADSAQDKAPSERSKPETAAKPVAAEESAPAVEAEPAAAEESVPADEAEPEKPTDESTDESEL